MLESHELSRTQAVPLETSPCAKRSFLLLACGLVATFWIYLDVFQWLVGRWLNSEDHSHGFVVPVFCLYLLWVRREDLADARESDVKCGPCSSAQP